MDILTPEQLMRSRYDAFVRMDADYLAKTTTQNDPINMSNYEDIEWLKLEVIEAKYDEVEYKAYYREYGKIYLIHELSKFVKKGTKWFYDSGIMFDTKIHRNEPCPCGSGKKYKQCCMGK